jgi:hypothetical protein
MLLYEVFKERFCGENSCDFTPESLVVFKSLFGIVPGVGTLAVPAIPGVFVVILMLVVNLVLRARRLTHIEFSHGEILLTYIIIAVGSLILDRGLLAFFVFTPMGLQNLVFSGIDTATYEPLFDEISRLILPKSLDAIQGFYLGGSSVPWGEWIFPIVLWSLFFFVFAFVVMCVISFVIRYWNDIEHLPYPVANIMSEMSMLPQPESRSASIWTNRVAWAGMAVSGVWALSHLVHRYFPVIPAVPYVISYADLLSRSQILPLMTWYYIWEAGVPISPAVIGISFLVQLDVLFSIWFMWLVQCVLAYANFHFRGASMENMFALWPDQIRLGGLLGMGIVTIWLCRHEIVRITKAALSGSDSSSKEHTMSPTVTFFGFILGLLFLVGFTGIFLKLNPIYSTIFFIVAILGPTVALARVRAEAGVPSTGNPTASFLEQGLFQPVVGTDRMGAVTLFKFQYVMPISYGNLPAIMATMMDSYKMGDSSRVNRKVVTWCLLFAVIAALVVGWPVALHHVYENGASIADPWIVRTGGYVCHEASIGGFGATFKEPNIIPVLVMLGSIGVTILLMVLRSTFVWWPIHPIGYAMSLNGWLKEMFLTFMIVWFIKMLVMRYGGSHIYNRLKPFFIGLVIGHAIIHSIGALLGIILPPIV